MGVYKEQCAKHKNSPRKSFKWEKRSMHRRIRRQVRQDPEDAWRKYYFRGTYGE